MGQRQELLAEQRRLRAQRSDGSSQRAELLAAKRGEKPQQHHGILDTIEHAAGAALHGAGRFARSSAAGLYALGKAELHDIGAINEALHRPSKFRDIHLQTPPIARQMARQTVEDIRHPLRDPFATALDVASLASFGAGSVARAAAATRAVRAGEGAAAAARALTRAAAPAPRVLRVTNAEGKTATAVAGSYSRATLTRQAQKVLDRLRERYPHARIGLLTHVERVGRVNRRNIETLDKLAQIPAAQLRAVTDKLSDIQHTALRVAAEGAPIEERQKALRAVLRKQERPAKSPGVIARRRTVAREIRREIALLEAAKPLVRNVVNEHGILVPRLVDPGLRDVLDRIRDVVSRREQAAIGAGLLSPEAAASRRAAPGRIFKGARVENGKLVGAEHFSTETVPDLIRIPYSAKPARLGRFTKGVGPGGVVGVQRKPGTLTHSYGGKIQLAGGGRKNVGKIVAEDFLQLARYLRSEQVRQYFRRFGQASPEGLRDPVAVRLRRNVKLRPDLERLIRQREEGVKLTEAEDRLLRDHLRDAYEDVFPKNVPLEPQPGIVWVERRLLGGLDNPHVPAAPGTTAARARNFIDSVNNAGRLAYILLKPAYAVPNLLSNAALHLIQAGFAAPRNLARAVRLDRYVGADARAVIDELVSEGISSVLRSEGGVAGRAATALANVWGKGVDLPFRRASFLHEAALRGFDTPEKLRALISDPNLKNKLLEVAHEANRALIDYADLNDFERALVRRVIFVYPWVKGSAKYSARFVANHPAQAFAVEKVAQVGEPYQQQLGPLPSYALELIPVGGGRTINPTSAGIFGTTADLLSTVENVLTGNAGSAFQALGVTSPAVQAAVEILTGRDGLGRPIHGSRPVAVAKEMASSVPLVTTARALRGHTSKSYPMSKQQALLAAILSRAVVPVNTNQQQLNKIAGYERSGR